MKLFTFILFLGISVSAFSQADFDKRLLERFSEEQIQALTLEQSPALDYWNYYLDHGYEIVDVPTGKTTTASQFPEIKYKSKEKFNVLDLGVSMDAKTKKYFKIRGSNQLLMLYSRDEFSQLFNEYRMNNKN